MAGGSFHPKKIYGPIHLTQLTKTNQPWLHCVGLVKPHLTPLRSQKQWSCRPRPICLSVHFCDRVSCSWGEPSSELLILLLPASPCWDDRHVLYDMVNMAPGTEPRLPSSRIRDLSTHCSEGRGRNRESGLGYPKLQIQPGRLPSFNKEVHFVYSQLLG